MEDVLYQTEMETTYYYAVVSMTGPVFGALLSGPLVNAFGGFESKLAMPLSIAVGTCAVVCALPMSHFEEFKHFI